MIYHITTRNEWQSALQIGAYKADSLHTQGFIHLSGKEQIIGVADAIYRGRNDLVILVVDPEKLTAELRYEAPDPSIPKEHHEGELFPHLYGALNTNAVKRAIAFPCQKDGMFKLPEELA